MCKLKFTWFICVLLYTNGVYRFTLYTVHNPYKGTVSVPLYGYTHSTHIKKPPLLFVSIGVKLHIDDSPDPLILILSCHIILFWTPAAHYEWTQTRRPVMKLRRGYERRKLHHESSLPMALAILKIRICRVTLNMCQRKLCLGTR